MAIAYITNSAAASSTASSITLGAAVAVGDRIVGATGWDNLNGAILNTITDNLGNSYTKENNFVEDATNDQAQQTWTCSVTVAGTPLITSNFSGTTNGGFRICVAAYSGTATTSALDGTVGQFEASPGTGTNGANSTAITTTANGDLVVGFWQSSSLSGGTLTAGTNFTKRVEAGATVAIGLEDLIQTTAGSIEATWTLSVNNRSITHVVTYKAAAVSQVPRTSPYQSLIAQ